jgi:hypothetical protein
MPLSPKEITADINTLLSIARNALKLPTKVIEKQ